MLASPALCQNVPNWNWIWAGDSFKTPDTVFFDQRFLLPKKCGVGPPVDNGGRQLSAYLNEVKKAVVQGND